LGYWGIAQSLFSQSNIGHVILSMTYFVDAEIQKDNPDDLRGITWESVKNKMKNAVAEYVKQQL
jgi:hypothetical protein